MSLGGRSSARVLGTCSRRLGTTKVVNVFKEAFLLYKVKHSDGTHKLGHTPPPPNCTHTHTHTQPQRTHTPAKSTPVFNNGLNTTRLDSAQLSWLCSFIYSCKHAPTLKHHAQQRMTSWPLRIIKGVLEDYRLREAFHW